MKRWTCPACQWAQAAHPAYGWSVRDERAVEVHQTLLCKGWTPCTYGEAHPAEVTFVWIEANGINTDEHRSPACKAHAPHIIARATVTPGETDNTNARPGIVILRMERAT